MTNLLDSTRDRILAAAEELFARTGVATTSLRAITALARVNLAAVNYHFGSKDGLVEACREEGCLDMGAHLIIVGEKG